MHFCDSLLSRKDIVENGCVPMGRSAATGQPMAGGTHPSVRPPQPERYDSTGITEGGMLTLN